MIDLHKTVKEIREIISQKQKELQLSFIEDTHTYYINNNGKIISNYPSVSTVIELFYEPFNAESKALDMCCGNVNDQQKLLSEWKAKGDCATNMGSRVHYELEIEAIKRYGNYKTVRKPIFECDEQQIIDSDNMIIAGKKFLDLMIKNRNCVLLDTETVMGSNNLGYFGTPDKLWLTLNKNKNEILLYISDWKTNQPKNFIPQPYTNMLFPPFENYYSTALEHYYLQLPLYVKLLYDMLKGSKYENIRFAGGIVVLLKNDATYQEYRVPKLFIDEIFKIDIKKMLN